MLDEISDKNDEPESEKESDFDAIDRTMKSAKNYEKYAESDKYEEQESRRKKDAKFRKMQNQFNYYFVVYFETDEDKNEFCKKHGLDYDFVFGEDLINILGKEVKK